MNKIYVSIASYRDPLLFPTINSLMENESGRNDIVYGIFEQCSYEDSLENKHPELVSDAKIRYKRIDPEYSDGTVWARAINAMQVYDEEFFYQVDSHMLFDKDWDHFLILDYNRAKKLANTEKIILSSGTKNYELNDNQILMHTLTEDITVKFGYYQFKKNLQMRVHGPWIAATEEVTPAIHAIAGNFFTITKWIKDVGFNTRLFFDAEEQYMAISSILAGYKLYHQRKIKCYHYLNVANHKTKQHIDPVVPIWKIEKNKEREEKELVQYIYSLSEDQLKEYYKITGVDYINRKLEDRAISKLAKHDSDLINDWEIGSIGVDGDTNQLIEKSEE